MKAAPLVALSHHLLAEALTGQGKAADAERQRGQAATVLEEIRAEAGGDGPLTRADLAPIAKASGLK